jgi:hypothetical protein
MRIENIKVMNYLKSLITLIIAFVLFTSCDKVDEFTGNVGLSETDIIEGLKEALRVATDTASGKLSVTDGYFKDELVKLLLPTEVSNSLTDFKSKSINIPLLGEFTGADIYTTGIPGYVTPLADKEADLVLGLNRAAEKAATEAAPIFIDAITGITIEDGNEILFGGVDTAATAYLDDKTRSDLFDKYEPKIDAALNSVTVGGKSVVEMYEDYVTKYNTILNTSVPSGIGQTKTIAELMSMNPVQEDDLSEYSTNKGLTGLFLKVADEERLIRTSIANRVTDILRKIFGELD